eukprot:6151693-Pyramimonas_sp.AAC.1
MALLISPSAATEPLIARLPCRSRIHKRSSPCAGVSSVVASPPSSMAGLGRQSCCGPRRARGLAGWCT